MMGVLEAIERRRKFSLDGFIARRELIPEDSSNAKFTRARPVRVS